MQPPFIQAELTVRGWPPTRIAQRLRVTRSAVSRVIHGQCRSRRIANEIARVVGQPAHQLWPGHYAQKVNRLTSAKREKSA
ncbi:MAG: helix-turn-helix domain-containing protein [Panacagrimonas sp.]